MEGYIYIYIYIEDEGREEEQLEEKEDEQEEDDAGASAAPELAPIPPPCGAVRALGVTGGKGGRTTPGAQGANAGGLTVLEAAARCRFVDYA